MRTARETIAIPTVETVKWDKDSTEAVRQVAKEEGISPNRFAVDAISHAIANGLPNPTEKDPVYRGRKGERNIGRLSIHWAKGAVDPDLRQRAKKYASEHNMTLSSFIRRAVKARLDARKPEPERLREMFAKVIEQGVSDEALVGLQADLSAEMRKRNIPPPPLPP